MSVYLLSGRSCLAGGGIDGEGLDLQRKQPVRRSWSEKSLGPCPEERKDCYPLDNS